jgi:hypothetical protein
MNPSFPVAQNGLLAAEGLRYHHNNNMDQQDGRLLRPLAAAAAAHGDLSRLNGPKPKFVHLLHEMVSTCPDAIVGFSKRGDSFEIRDTQRLAEEVLGEFFSHRNLSSFYRQLNLYGFSKLRTSSCVNLYDIHVL